MHVKATILALLTLSVLTPAFAAPRYCTQSLQNERLHRCEWYLDSNGYTVYGTDDRTFHVDTREKANRELQAAENSGFCQRISCTQLQNCTTAFEEGHQVIYAQIVNGAGKVALRVASVGTPGQVPEEMRKLRDEGSCL